MLIFSRCDGKYPDFCAMIAELDEDLLARYGAQDRKSVV